MSNKNRQIPNANQKRENNLALYLLLSIYIHIYIYIYTFIYIYIYIYSVICIYPLRSVEHKVLRYIPLNLNNLNTTDVLHLRLTTVL